MELRPRLVDITLVCDTSIYANGDVIVATMAIPYLARDKNRCVTLESIVVIDEDDQGVAFDIYFLDANVSVGAANAAWAPSDTVARSFLGKVPIASGDWKDMGGARVASLGNLGIVLKPETDTQNVYVAILNGAGTPTFTASGLKLRLGLVD